MKENTGNIKDYYKISSCIGRGKYFDLQELDKSNMHEMAVRDMDINVTFLEEPSCKKVEFQFDNSIGSQRVFIGFLI